LSTIDSPEYPDNLLRPVAPTKKGRGGGGALPDIGGDVGAVDNVVVRSDGTTGDTVQGSGVIVSDTNVVLVPSLTASKLVETNASKELVSASYTAAGIVALLHDAVTLDTNADEVLSLTVQEIGLQNQAPNTFFAGSSVSYGTPVTDNFNRANNNSLGANWTESEDGSAARISINTNQLILGDNSDVGIARYTGVSWGPNQYSQLKFVSRLGGPCGGPAVRMSGTYDSFTGYVAYNSATDIYIYKFVAQDLPTSGGGTELATAPCVIPANGLLRIEAFETTISVYVDGYLRLQTTDSDIATGDAGVVANGWGTTWDDWEGADTSSVIGVPAFRELADGDFPPELDIAIAGLSISDSSLHITNAEAYFGDSNSYIVNDGNNLEIVSDDDIEVTCGANKTIELQNVVYDDIRVTPGSFDRPGISDPDIVAYDVNGGGVSTYLWEFAKNDIASFTVQLPHSYKPGQDIKVHLHWTPGPRGNEESGNAVGWKVDYSWANIDGAFGTMATADLSDACDGVDHRHQMTPEVTITGTSKAISSMLLCNVKRTDTGTDDTWASSTTGQLPLLLEIDFHFPIDTMGSRDWGTK
jgi:hypothetical protein